MNEKLKTGASDNLVINGDLSELAAGNFPLGWAIDNNTTVSTKGSSPAIVLGSCTTSAKAAQVLPTTLKASQNYILSFNLAFSSKSASPSGAVTVTWYDSSTKQAIGDPWTINYSSSPGIQSKGFTFTSDLSNPTLAFCFSGDPSTEASINNISLPGSGSETPSVSKGSNLVTNPEFGSDTPSNWTISSGSNFHKESNGSWSAELNTKKAGSFATLSQNLPIFLNANDTYTFTLTMHNESGSSTALTNAIQVRLYDPITMITYAKWEGTPPSNAWAVNVTLEPSLPALSQGALNPTLEISLLSSKTEDCTVHIKDPSLIATGREGTAGYIPFGFQDRGFSQVNFTVLDYRIGSPPTPYQEHYQTLYNYVKAYKMRKVLLFPNDPSTETFFSADGDVSDPNTFLYWLNQFGQLKYDGTNAVETYIFFTWYPFDNAKPFSPTYGLSSDFYFEDLPQKMNWIQALKAKVPSLTGVGTDPEKSGNGPQYQKIINYMDEYRSTSSNNCTDLKLMITYGVESKTDTLANLSTFPITGTIATLAKSVPYFPSVDGPTWRQGTDDPTRPLLDEVYLQTYSFESTYLYSIPEQPETQAAAMNRIMKGESYMPGSGTCSVNTGSKNVTGSGTAFTKDVVQYSPLGITASDESYVNLGKVISIQNDTSLTLKIANCEETFSQRPWWYFEPSMASDRFHWNVTPGDPAIPSNIINNIYFLFSLDNSFFGKSPLQLFMSFMTAFYHLGQSSSFYGTEDKPIPVPNNMAIYDWSQLRDKGYLQKPS